VPTISEFFGIKILMYWDEHNPHELMNNWESAKVNGKISRIDPLK
jgi:hypothetical protein